MKLRNKIIVGVIIASTIGGCAKGCKNFHRFKRIRYEQSQQPIEAIVLNESYENRLSPVPEKHISGLVSQAYSRHILMKQ